MPVEFLHLSTSSLMSTYSRPLTRRVDRISEVPLRVDIVELTYLIRKTWATQFFVPSSKPTNDEFLLLDSEWHHGARHASGRPVGAMDVTISETNERHDLALVTCKISDFNYLQLRLLNLEW
jgi:predicted nucleic acid-binding protein